jgi:hypothetical protein
LIDIEAVPELSNKKCRYIAFAIGTLFNIFPIILFFLAFLIYNIYFAIGMLVVSYIFTSVYISKIRYTFIPFEQNELDYNNYQIAKFYTKKNFCFKGINY